MDKETSLIDETERAIAINPHHASTLAGGGTFLAIVGQWETGLSLVEKAIFLNPHYPGWYHLAPCFYYYIQGSFQQALIEVSRMNMNMPNLFLEPLLRAAILGELGEKQEASIALAQMQNLLPNVELSQFLQRTFFEQKNVEQLLTGLYKAGLSHLLKTC